MISNNELFDQVEVLLDRIMKLENLVGITKWGIASHKRYVKKCHCGSYITTPGAKFFVQSDGENFHLKGIPWDSKNDAVTLYRYSDFNSAKALCDSLNEAGGKK